MNSVVVLRAADAAEQHFFAVRFVVAIGVGEDLHVVAGGNDHLGCPSTQTPCGESMSRPW